MNLFRPPLVAGMAAMAALLVWLVAQHLALGAARQALDQTLLLTSRAVEAEVDRLRALPEVSAEDARVRAALARTGSVQDANACLETVAVHAEADELFLIDESGVTIAASNWNRPRSFVGENYAFRPYFQDAITTGHGQSYAIGVTSGVPGYFLSARPDWQYRPLMPLDARVLEQLAVTRTYHGVGLARQVPLLSATPDGVDAAGVGWIARLAPMPAIGWQVIAARSTARLQRLAIGWAALAALATLAIAAALKAWEQRRQIIALRLSQSEKLESMVIARTTDLAREIDARIQAEAGLRATQEALVHTERMAALGRMST